MNRKEMLAVLGAKTLDQELRERGFGHRPSSAPSTGRTIFRIATGEVIGTMRAHDAWTWVKAGCPVLSSRDEKGEP